MNKSDKNVTTHWKRVVIDSRTRDLAAYPSPSSYDVPFADDINDAKSVRLVVADVPFSNYLVGAGASGSIPLQFGSNVAVAQLPVGDYASADDMMQTLAESLQIAATNVAGPGAPTFGVSYIPRSDSFAIMADAPFSIPFESFISGNNQYNFSSYRIDNPHIPQHAIASGVPPQSPARILGFTPNSNYASSSNTELLGFRASIPNLSGTNTPSGIFTTQTASYSNAYYTFSNLTATVLAATGTFGTDSSSWTNYDSINSPGWVTETSSYFNLVSTFANAANAFANQTNAFGYTAMSYVNSSNNPNIYTMAALSNASGLNTNLSTNTWIPSTTNNYIPESLIFQGYNSTIANMTATGDTNPANWSSFRTLASGAVSYMTSVFINDILTNWLPNAKSLYSSANTANNAYVLVSSSSSFGTSITSSSSQLPNVIVAPFRRDFRSDRYAVLKITPNSELLISTNQAINRTFAIIPKGVNDLNVNDTQSDTYQKRWNPPIGRIGRMKISFTDVYGQPYDFQNQDHRLEFLFECVGHPIP